MSGKSRRGQGSGGVYQRESDGLWVASVELGYEGDKRKRKYLYAKSQRTVIEKQTTALHAMQHALPVAFERQTVAQYLERWLAESVAPRLRATTTVSYTQQVRHHIIPALGRIQLAKLNPQQVQAFLNRKSASGLSSRTVLMQAMKWGLVGRNVAQLVDAPKSVRKEPVVFTPAEARAFLQAVKGERWEALYTAALACGLRRGEALGLQWGTWISTRGRSRCAAPTSWSAPGRACKG
jgi:integrase